MSSLIANTIQYKNTLYSTIAKVKAQAESTAALHTLGGTINAQTEALSKLILSSGELQQKAITSGITNLANNFESYYKQLYDNEGFDNVKEVRIGATRTTVPPEAIVVEEVLGSEIHQGLRTHNTFQIKTGRGDIFIRMKIEFPSIYSINNELRHIIAQFRTSALTSIESRYIYDAVMGKIDPGKTSATLEKTKRDLRKLLADEKKVEKELQDSIISAVGDTPLYEIPPLWDRIGIGPILINAPLAAAKLASDVREAIRNSGQSKEQIKISMFKGLSGTHNLERLLDRLISLRKARKDLADLSVSKLSTKYRVTWAIPVIPAVFDSLVVTTVPGYSDRLQCELALRVIHYLPYSDYFLFKNAFGGPTPSISKCPFWQEYYMSRMRYGDLALEELPTDRSLGQVIPGVLEILYPGNSTPEVDDDLGPSSTTETTKSYESSLESLLIPNGISIYFDGLDTYQFFYCQSVSFGISSSVSKTTVLSGAYPVYQHMGNAPVKATIRIMSKNSELGRIHEVKRAINNQLLSVDGRKERYNYIMVRNSIVQLSGFTKWQLDGITTTTVDPEWSSVEISLTSFVPPKLDVPQFIESFSGATTRQRLEDAWSRIFRMAIDFVNGKDLSKLTPSKREAVLLANRNTPEFQAYEAVFGDDSLLNVDSVAAVLAYNSDLKTPIFDYLENHRVALLAAGISPDDYTGYAPIDPLDYVARNYPHYIVSVLKKGKAEARPYNENFRRYIQIGDEISNKVLRASVNHIFSSDYSNIVTASDNYGERIGSRNYILRVMADSFTGVLPESASSFTHILNAVSSQRTPFEKEFDIKPTVSLLASITLGKNPKYEALSAYLKDKWSSDVNEEQENQLELYPDMRLPTYDHVYRNFLTSLRAAYDFDMDAVAVWGPLPEWISLLPDSLQEALRFPTDKNIEAVLEGKFKKLAVKGTDRVDPDFWFFGEGSGDLFEDIYKNSVEPALREFGIGEFGVTTAKEARAAMEEGAARLADVKKATHVSGTGKAGRDRNFDPPGNIASSPIHEMTSGTYDVIAGIESFDTRDVSLIQDNVRRIASTMPDTRNRMIQFYPTFQLYFLHEGKKGLLTKYTDWYGFNSILSMSVTRHKWQPDVAEIFIGNPMGDLDKLRFNKDKDDSSYSSASKISKDTSGENQRKDLVSSKRQRVGERGVLTEGTRIVIKLGYSSIAAKLETVFTGKIAEIDEGDILHIVAQGYGGELGFPVQQSKEVDLDTVWDNFKKRIGFSSERDHKLLALVHELMESQSAENFGGWGWAEIFKRKPGDMESDVAKASNILTGLPLLGDFFKASFYDPNLENIGGLIDGTFDRDFDEGEGAAKDVLRGKKTWWLKQDMTGLQALREITLMFPSHVFAVLPYDDRATLYIGRPESNYQYTREGREERIEAHLEAKNNPTLIRVIGPLSEKEENRTEELVTNLAKAFRDSTQGRELREFSTTIIKSHDFKNTVNKDRESAAVIYSKFSTLFGRSMDDTSAILFRLVVSYYETFYELNAVRMKDIISDKESSYPEVDYMRRYLILLFDFIESNITSQACLPFLTNKSDLNRLLPKTKIGTKPFRAYHFVDSHHDIVANNIIATRGVMKNIVRIFGGDDPTKSDLWKTVAIDDDLSLGDQMIGHFSSPNATDEMTLYLAGYGHLAEAMRPMYRGELVLRGRPTIKPHDIVFIYDTYNGIWGPIEVERITHHFSYETGFISTITPHLYCVASNEADWASTTGAGMLLGAAGAAVVVGLGVAVGFAAAPVVATGATVGAAVGIGKAIGVGLGTAYATEWGLSKLYNNLTGASIWGTFTGKGFLGRKENPVAIIPLMKAGKPLIAGMNGFSPNNWKWNKLIGKKWTWFKAGVYKTGSDISEAFDGLFGGDE